MSEVSTAVSIPSYLICGAKKPNSDPAVLCKNKAGKGTEHLGSGKCSKHGGNGGRPPTNGNKSTKPEYQTLRDAVLRKKQDTELLDGRENVALLSTILSQQIDRYDEAVANYQQTLSDYEVAKAAGVEIDFTPPPVPEAYVDVNVSRFLLGAQNVVQEMESKRENTYSLTEVRNLMIRVADLFHKIGREESFSQEVIDKFVNALQGIRRHELTEGKS